MALPKPKLIKPEDVKLNLLLYGNYGVGKTLLAATAQDHPLLAPVLFLNIEGGTMTIASRQDILGIDITESEQVEEVFFAIRNREEGYENIRTVIIDSCSDLQDMARKEWTQRNLEKLYEQNPKATRTIDEIPLKDYASAASQVGRYIRMFRDASFNVIVTAGRKDVYAKNQQGEKVGEPIEAHPNLYDSLYEKVYMYFDCMWYMYREEDGTRALLTDEMDIFRAKTRGSIAFVEALGQQVPNPNLAEIYELMRSIEVGQKQKAS